MTVTSMMHASLSWQDFAPLRPGDSVAVVALSSDPGEIGEVMAAIEYLQDFTGWRVDLVGWPDAGSSDPFSALAYLDRKRAIEDAIAGPYRMVWALRGGYGSTPLLADLPICAPTDLPRLLLGFSDTTALHAAWRRWGWPSMHADGLLRWAARRDRGVPCPLIGWLTGELTGWRRPVVPGNATARAGASLQHRAVWGGNLAVQSVLEGTGWAMRAPDGLALFEDVNETGYKIDRLWHHWLQAGGAASVSGVLWGDFTLAEDRDGVDRSPVALERWGKALDGCGIPAWHVARLGHGPIHWPLMMGLAITGVDDARLWQRCPWALKEDAWHDFLSV
jgi:muramoyltetrapeptide carboxypeptidase